ncbi:MAG: sulfur carrier protein ThiS [Clostridiales Family XIII bacterium]|nr:sulfur carrier protein ThiS [Clostridiales Family XIII bacterium]
MLEKKTVTVNGAVVEFEGGQSLADFLDGQGYDQRVIVIGLNDTIVPKSNYHSVILKDNDVLDVLNFVSGG